MITHKTIANLGLLLTVLLVAASSPAATTIFHDDFTGLGGLNGETPDVTTGGASWVASSAFQADGSFGPFGGGTNGSSATLAFTPLTGTTYNLDARADVTSSGNWLAFGFADGQSTNQSPNNRFVGGSTPEGRVWMLLDPDKVANTFQNGTSAIYGVDATVSSAGAIDLRIVLDTINPIWTATWYAKDASASTYTVVQSTKDVLSQGSINSLGFAGTGDAAGTITSFTFTNTIPEPASLALLGLGGLFILRRRR